MKINLVHKNIAILGFGKEGQSTLRFLQKNGINDYNIAIFDRDENLKVANFKGKIISGVNYLAYLDQYDFIFKSPGISPYTHNLKRFGEKILTQTKLFYEFYQGKIISITQTKGKSTTTTLVYNLLKNAGYNVKIVGNIGNPVLDEVDIQKDKYDFVVYELSSYMLEELQNHHSYISILGNIYPDHLDWHENFENYVKAKKNVFLNAENIFVGKEYYMQHQNDFENKNVKTFGGIGANIYHEGTKYLGEIEIQPQIPGEHNLHNFAAVLAVSEHVGISRESFQKTIYEFKGLKHRLENVGKYQTITFIDDAISTTPESTIEGIKSFGDTIDTIFLGGTDRGYEFEGLVQYLEQYQIKNIVLFPPSGSKIKSFLNDAYNVFETSDMEKAVDFAFKNTQQNKICLLSTASPSYSVWKNFEEKGDLFQYYVKNYDFQRKN